MACNWIKNSKGEIIGAISPNNIKSKLFEDLENTYGLEKAIEMYAVAYSNEFQDINTGTLKPSNSSNYANLTEDNKGNFVFYHIGADNYQTIKPNSGSNKITSRQEASALSKVGGVAMYYTRPSDSETKVIGTSKYMVKIPKNQVYDFNSDPLNLITQARELHSKEFPNGAFDANTQLAYVTKLANQNGYKMTVAQWEGRTRAQTVEELKPVDTMLLDGNTIVKPFNKDYKSNTEKGYKSVIPQTKQELLDQVYLKIHNERNSKNKYDTLYHLFSTGANENTPSLIENSDLPEELKAEYRNALNYQEGSRMSIKTEEPSMESLVKFITDQNENKVMSNQNKIDLQNFMLSTKETNPQKLINLFFDDSGLFSISVEKLKKSGYYSDYEITKILDDVELQDSIKSAVEGLKNNSEDILPLEEFDNLVKVNTFNSFGKMNVLNPYVLEQDAIQKLGGLSKTEFESALEEFPDKTVSFEQMSQYSTAEVLRPDGTQKPVQDTLTIIPQTAKISDDVAFIDSLPTSNITEEYEKKVLENLGIDITGFKDKLFDAQLVQSLHEFALSPNKQNTEKLVENYNRVFEVDNSPKKEKIKADKNLTGYVTIKNTPLTEEQLFTDKNLVKVSKDTYIKVTPKPLEELYQIVGTHFKEIKNLEKYIQDKAVKNEALELYKMYFGIESEKQETTPIEYSQKFGNVEDFISDFYIKMIKEKNKDSELWKNYYSNFEINEQGIGLKSTDPITMDSIKLYADEKMKDYSLVSKQIPNLKETEEKPTDRDIYFNAPENIEETPVKELSKIDEDSIILKNNTEQFIKVDSQVYELQEVMNNLSLYTKIGVNDQNHYIFGVEKKSTDLKLKDYAHLSEQTDSFTKVKKYLSKEEKDLVDCR